MLVDHRLGLSDGTRTARLLQQVSELVAEEAEIAQEGLFAAAKEHTAACLRTAAADDGDDDALCIFWTFLWQRLWELTDFEQTIPYPQEWHRLALPFLWLQNQRPENFHSFTATRSEECLIDAMSKELQSMAAEVGHPTTLDFPIMIWTDPLLEEYSQLANLVGTAAKDFAPPRGLVLLSSEYLETVRPPRGYWSEHLAGMITHEIIHLYWSETYPEGEEFPDLVLHHALEEAATTLLEQIIHYRLSQTVSGRKVDELAESLNQIGYAEQTRNLLQLLYVGSGHDPWQQPELLWKVMECVCSQHEEAELAAALNSTFGTDHPLEWWRRQFSEPYLKVCSRSVS